MSALALTLASLEHPRTTSSGWLAFDMRLYIKDTDSGDSVTASAIARFYNHGELPEIQEDDCIYCMVVTTVRFVSGRVHFMFVHPDRFLIARPCSTRRC